MFILLGSSQKEIIQCYLSVMKNRVVLKSQILFKIYKSMVSQAIFLKQEHDIQHYFVTSLKC